jgi:general secretion pathway protein G
MTSKEHGDAGSWRRGEIVFSVSPGHRVTVSHSGFSLIELIITVSVLAILTMGVIPLVQVSVKRQKEYQLRSALREMREAIDQFHREAVAGAQMQVNQRQGTGQGPANPQPVNPQPQNPGNAQGPNVFADPRVRVAITDQTIFTADNPDRYPPDLETLVKGVDVLPMTTAGGMGGRGVAGVNATDVGSGDSAVPKTKIYLRQIPIDPMTGSRDWVFSSCYDAVDSTSWGGENVFNVHSKSQATALNGEKYSDW